MYGLSTSMLLLLHSTFMLRVVKMLLKEEVCGSALNSHGNYIADHGKIMELCFQISVGSLKMAIIAAILKFFKWHLIPYHMLESKETWLEASGHHWHRFRLTIFLNVKLWIFSYPSVLTYVLGAQKNCLNETVLLSTHNICFGREIRKINFWYTLFTKGLIEIQNW